MLGGRWTLPGLGLAPIEIRPEFGALDAARLTREERL
jgi:hypothetical protein